MSTISVVIPTLGRVEEVDRLLDSLARGTRLPDEVIIIDQNEPHVLAELELKYRNVLNLHRKVVAFKGLSRAKNEGASAAKGDFVLIPDDDCRLFPDTIQASLDLMLETGADVIFGKSVDETGADSLLKFRTESGWLSLKQMDGMFVEPTMMCRRYVFATYLYDETMGVGCFHGAEEGYDWVLRLLKDNVKIFFSPSLLFYHPQVFLDHASQKAIKRVFFYRAGYAKLCKKNALGGKYISRLLKVCLMMVFCLVFRKNKFRYYVSEIAGLMAGFVID